MSKIDRLIILVILVLLGFLMVFCEYIYEERNPEAIIIKTKPKVIIQKVDPIGVTMTAYSPDKSQCQGNPRETASGLIINQQSLWEVKYIAISRDLREKYNLPWGSSIYVEFLVVDLMGEKAQGKITENTIDWFMEIEEAALQFGNQVNRKIIILEE